MRIRENKRTLLKNPTSPNTKFPTLLWERKDKISKDLWSSPTSEIGFSLFIKKITPKVMEFKLWLFILIDDLELLKGMSLMT
jgi:hypothetical protein